MNLRQAHDSDKLAVSEILKSIAFMYDGFMPGVFYKQASKYEEKLPSKYLLNVVEVQEEVIGFYSIEHLSEKNLYLRALYIHSDYHRQGYGKQALYKIIDQASKRGYESLYLLVHEKAIWAQNFYYKYGFQKRSEDQKYIEGYKDGILKNYYIKNTVLLSKDIV